MNQGHAIVCPWFLIIFMLNIYDSKPKLIDDPDKL